MSQKLLSICIPTYNRADCLKRLLNNIIPQILEFKEEVEICISNNGSTDNTREIVMNLKEKYPDLIKYNENEENLRFDRNVLEVVNMVQGEFVWTCSDDDLLVKNGLKEVMRFIMENKDKKMGGMVIKFSSYIVDARTGKRIKYQSSVDENKPETYGGLSFVEILQDDIPYQGLSVLIFNNRLLKKIIREKQDLVKKGIGTNQLHSWLFFLLFLLNKKAECYVLNKSIVISPDTMSKTKYMMEDYVNLIYTWRIKFFDDLLLIIDKSEKDIIKAVKKLKGHPIISIIYIMALYKAFGAANYTSYIRCIKLSFKYFSFLQALLTSVSAIIILIIPSRMLKKLCKLSMRVRPRTRKKVESTWLETCIAFSSLSRGEGRWAEETAEEYNSLK
ncbi:MAG: glycosyltransferase family 2 protein [Candidatus Portnoybacteria bacterium]